MAEYTPMMLQYFKVKENYPDTILFYRLGDFYEMFFEDAKIASKELELCLTGRNCGMEERAPMCGVPFHSAESYIARLVSKGYKVAVCEQTEDPKATKGIVTRDVVRVHTPGTAIESNVLDEGKNNFLGCVFGDESNIGICFADVSTGEMYAANFSLPEGEDKAINELAKYLPSEVIINTAIAENQKIKQYLELRSGACVEQFDNSIFESPKCERIVTAHFNKSLDELSLGDKKAAVCAVGVALEYLKNVQKHDLLNINRIDVYVNEKYMELDATARLHLELCETQRRREKYGSLLWVLDKTKTPMGKRLIRSWIDKPLVNVPSILLRQNAIEELFSDTALRSEITELICDINDLERVLTRVVFGTANARELRSLVSAVSTLPELKSLLASSKSKLMQEIYSDIDTLEDISELIDEAITEEPPITVREGHMIKKGFNSELDSLHEIVNGGKGFLTEIEQREQEKTGIKKLKIGYNRVFGYYIEVLNSYKELVPENYIRKQTLSNCERYITEELKELESKVLGAQERIVNLEYEIFVKIRNKVSEAQYRFTRTAKAIARLDTLCSLALVAVENGYERPEIDDSGIIDIKDGRHPVVEKALKGAPFVPNDTYLDTKDDVAAIITGPNMAGKSTYMRQTALIVIMAQIGSFVPARSARIGIVDAVFTRVGASDDLAAGQSTFMLEMSEVASILKNATSRSLIILDEIGRGTSTYDGMSIARAVLEYIVNKKKIGAKTLFATHYHELTALEGELPGVKNYNTSVKKRGDDITFLRRIIRGGADGSFGIEVALLAGVPGTIVTRAREILKDLESGEAVINAPQVITKAQEPQLSFESSFNNDVIRELEMLDVNTLTPIEALTKLYELKNKLK